MCCACNAVVCRLIFRKYAVSKVQIFVAVNTPAAVPTCGRSCNLSVTVIGAPARTVLQQSIHPFILSGIQRAAQTVLGVY